MDKVSTKNISVFEYLDYRLFLDALYLSKKNSKKRYSYLQFSEDLGFSKTNVIHLIIKGKRPLTNKAAQKICNNIEISNKDKNYFLKLVEYHNTRNSDERENLFKILVKLKSEILESPEVQSQLEFFSEWYHIIIYQMTFLKSFSNDTKIIAKQVSPNIRPEQARKSLQLLEQLKLIEFDRNLNRMVPTKLRVSTGDEIASIAITRYHQKMIDLAKESITNVKSELRDISAASISIPIDMIPSLKQEISIFRKKVLALADQQKDRSEEVYQLNIQLFPTSNLSGVSKK